MGWASRANPGSEDQKRRKPLTRRQIFLQKQVWSTDYMKKKAKERHARKSEDNETAGVTEDTVVD